MDMSSVSLEQVMELTEEAAKLPDEPKDTELRAALEAQGKGKDPFGFSDGRTSAEPDRIEPGFATQNAKVGPVGTAIIWIFLLLLFGLSIAVTTVPREAAGPVAGLEDPTAALQPYQMQ